MFFGTVYAERMNVYERTDMSATPSKKERRILKWSAAAVFLACWVVPVIPVNYEFQPLSAQISEFLRCLREGYYFTATGYALLLIFIASIAFLLSVSLGFGVERAVRFFQRPKKDDREVVG